MKNNTILMDRIEKPDISTLSWPKRLGLSFLRIFIRTWIKFGKDRCFQRASGLSFSTILAIVPLMAIFVGFGGGSAIFSDGVKKIVAETLLPTSQGLILDAFESFIENSKKLGTVGLIFFLITAIFLCSNIENHFNTLLRSRPNKEPFTRAAVYISTLIFGSLFIGASFSFTSPIVSLATSFTMEILQPVAIQLLFSGATIFFIMLVIITLINGLTTAKVRFRSSLFGGLIGAIFWEISKRLFTLWAGASVRNSIIYGSLFIIPLLFLWVYIGWIIILISVEITYVHQHKALIDWKYHNREAINPYRDILTGLEIYLYIARCFFEKRDPPSSKNILAEFELPEDSFFKMINKMEKTGYVYFLSSGKQQLVPSSPPDQVILRELIHDLSGVTNKGNITSAEDQLCAIRELEQFFNVEKNEINKRTIKDILTES